MAEEAEGEAPPAAVPEAAPEVEAAPDAAPEAAEAAPDAAPEAAEAAPKAVPEAVPEAAAPPEVAPEAPPDVAVETAPEDTPVQDEPGGSGLQSYLTDSALLKIYASECHIANRKVNPLVERCLLEAAEAKKETFYIEAPGNDKRTFTCRLADEDLLILSKVCYVVSPFLCRLDLSYNHLGDAGVKCLAYLLGPRASALTSLRLRSNAIGAEGCQALCESLRPTPLRRLDMAMNPLGKEGGLMLVSFLQHSPDLLELFMGDTEADIDVLVSLAAVLRRHPSKLAVLDVQNPRIFTLQEEHTVHLGKMLRNNTSITELYLGKQRMRDEGARQLVDFLLENKVLRVLDLRCNELGAVSAYCIGTLLAHGSQLVFLNLSCNRIGEKDNVDGAKALAEGLRHNRHLEHLDLNHNELCGQALTCLGEPLGHSTKLVSLRLFHNHWDQPSSYLFHSILHGRSKGVPLKADFKTSEVDQQIHISKVEVDR